MFMINSEAVFRVSKHVLTQDLFVHPEVLHELPWCHWINVSWAESLPYHDHLYVKITECATDRFVGI